jgi:hypothetical protein
VDADNRHRLAIEINQILAIFGVLLEYITDAREVSIAANPTSSDQHHPHADDAQARLRAELLGQLVAGQFALEAALSELAGADPAIRDRLRSQIGLLAGLQQQVGTATGGALSALRAEVANLADSATAAARDARTSAADSLAANSPAAAARQTILDLSHDYYDRKVLDPYLKFQSEEDEKAYRKRELENQEAIRRELAKGTPEGDHNAALIFNRQLNDARDHGADASPDFADIMRRSQEAVRDTGANIEQPKVKATQPNITPPPVPDSELADVSAILKSAGVTTLAENTSSPGTAGTPRINRETTAPARS